MDTKAFGPCTWDALFFIAAGYDVNKEDSDVKNKHYKAFFKELGYVLGCSYCRESYKVFFKELDIDKYFNKPRGLLKFVYDLKNKVNHKLITQECQVALKKYELLEKCTTNDEKNKMLNEIRDICYTKSAPDFELVYKKYESHRAKCKRSLKSCRK